MLIGDHEDCLECSGIDIAVLWLELVILVRKPVGSQIVSVAFNSVFPSAISRYLVSNKFVGKSWTCSKSMFPSAISRYLVSNISWIMDNP